MPVDLQALYPKLIHLMLDTVFVVDRDNTIVFVSNACEALLGYRADELIGTPITRYMHPEDLEATYASINRVMNGQSHQDFRNRYLRKDGAVVHILWAASWSEEVGARIGVARNVTALTRAEEELRFLAHHDPLTRLCNRALFNQRLATALQRKQPLALLFLDINDFKGINDAYGHAMGDRVLCAVARRLESCVGAQGTVARMGGDEFTVLLTELASAGDLARMMAEVLAAMAQPLGGACAGLRMPTCSIGVACYPEDGEDIDTLLNCADDDMYRQKRRRSVVG
ncbi:diguanylate cyclase [Pantoea sp. Tr-811]|uniref:GGDEF domain-containing protein n=1 Tax=unclassified Pantoea TaxID=2630326 RepID=UPI00141E63F4|nr:MULTISPECIES: GGDEF domain-containing protein [unclassified Pantoea]NIE73369.1 diguanylate cyclase [Pantoea sp. Ap-967]NIF27636.1 diguanylate cyclase [Pantoea sp. Tr-811]